MSAEPFDAFAAELEERFSRGIAEPWPDFDEQAVRAFGIQFEGNAVYRAFCEGRGVHPGTVEGWASIPAVPTAGFKHLDLVVGHPAQVERTFLTSGTTRGRERRGRHLVRSLDLYRASLLPNLQARLLPDGAVRRHLALIPPPEAAPHSSLSWMVGAMAGALVDDTDWTADADGLPSPDRFDRVARDAIARGDPVVVTGTAFGLVHLLDAAARDGLRWPLPEGSTLMETGGFKGRSRTLSREDLHAAIHDRLAIRPERMVGEYGMTELLSQLWEPVLERGTAARGVHAPPPWLAVRALDPTSLEVRAEGEEGILAYCDLANAGSVCAVLTEDVGSVTAEGVRLSGRARGAEPRGCSLAVEDLLRAGGAVR